MPDTFAVIPTNTCPETLEQLEAWGHKFHGLSPWIQLDIGDGNFVPALSWPYRDQAQWQELVAMGEHRKLLLDVHKVNYEVHLMVKRPEPIGVELAKAGVKRIIAHRESFVNPDEFRDAVTAWRKYAPVEVGIAVLMDTQLGDYEQFLPHCDTVLLMSIPYLGFQGAPFDERIYEKVRTLHAKYPQLPIAIDGGVNQTNIHQLREAGALRFGIGSAISKAGNPQEAYHQLVTLARL